VVSAGEARRAELADCEEAEAVEPLVSARAGRVRIEPPKGNQAAGRFSLRGLFELTRRTTAIEVPSANNSPPPLRKRRTSLATARLTSPFRLSLKATSFKIFLSCVTCADTRMLRHPQGRCHPLRPKTGHGLA